MKTVYKTKNLRFEFWDESHMTKDYFDWFHDERVIKHNSHGLFPYTEKAKEEFLEDIKMGDRIVFAVFACEEAIVTGRKTGTITQDRLIGNAALSRFDYIYRSAEFSIVIGDSDAWGRGYGTEILKILLKHGFEKLNLHRIWTGTSATNRGMQKVAIKAGLKKEGVFREGMFLNGKYEDIYSYSILRHEYSGEKDSGIRREGGDKIGVSVSPDNPLERVDAWIETIEQTRGKNNNLWMKLLRNSLKTEEGRKTIEEILANDIHISNCVEVSLRTMEEKNG